MHQLNLLILQSVWVHQTAISLRNNEQLIKKSLKLSFFYSQKAIDLDQFFLVKKYSNAGVPAQFPICVSVKFD